MRRGPPPTRGFDITIPIAMGRGSVMLFQQLPEHVCDFSITGNGIFALVRIMATTRLHETVAEISWRFSGAIAGLSTLPFGGPISRELWLYSRYGTMRFFRVLETGLVEIDCHGFLFVNGKPVITLPTNPRINPLPSGTVVPVSGGPGPAITEPGRSPNTTRSPAIHRSGKKQAGKKPEPEENNPIRSGDPASDKNCVHKKPAAGSNPGPIAGLGAPTGEPGIAGRKIMPCDGTPVNSRDRTLPPGKPEVER
ncbi:hypothetical protein [Methanoregula sp.]|uniref:hypothetical protein n=1 Tax=Methanoregula sp. TaxID=2052170 RepID=UPI00261BAF08|nr:hypothetical protein [Methanoregula sp.]MDD5141851.1 hypothetical protein [Methanoregula sp.]